MISERKNSFWLSLRYLALLCFSLINYKINIIQFGEELFGAWILILAIWNLGNAIDLGMGTAIIKFTAEYSTKKKSDLQVYLASSFYIFIILGMGLTILIYFIGTYFFITDNKLFINTDSLVIKHTYLALAIAFIIKYVSIFFRSVFEGLSNFVITSKIEILSACLTFIFVCLTYVLNLSLIHLAIFYILVSIVSLVIYFLVYLKKFSFRSLTYKAFCLEKVKQLFEFSLHIQIFTLINGLIDPIIKFLLGGFMGLNTITFYEIGRRIATSISGLFFTTFRTVLPKASVLKDISEQRKFLLEDTIKYMRFGVFYSILFFGVGAIFITIFIKVFYGNIEYISIFLILALAESLTIFGSTIYTFIMGIGKGKFLTVLQTMNVILISFSVYIGLYLFNNMLGLLGYFIAIVLGNVLLLLFIRNQFSISIYNFLTEVKLTKLILFLGTLTVSIFLIYYIELNIYLIMSLFSFLMILLLLSEFKYIHSNLLRIVKR